MSELICFSINWIMGNVTESRYTDYEKTHRKDTFLIQMRIKNVMISSFD